MKCNLGDLHRANKISSNFELEKQHIRKKILALISHTISFSLLSSLSAKMQIINSKLAI